MIVVHPATPAEYDEWDAFVQSHPAGIYFQLSWWIRCQERRFIRTSIVVIKDGGRIVAGAGCFRFGLPAPWLNVTVVTNAPLVSPDCPAALGVLLEAIDADCRRYGSILLQLEAFDAALFEPMRTHFSHRRMVPEQVWKLYSPGIWREFRIPLAGRSPDELMRGFSRIVRRQVREAEEAGARVEEVAGEEGIRAAHQVWVQSLARNPHAIRTYADFRSLTLEAQKRGMVHLLLARVDGEPAAFMFSLFYGCGATALHSAFTDKYAHIPCTRLLAWRTILAAVERGVPYLSVGGPHGDKDGVHSFKERFHPELADHRRCIAVILKPMTTRAAQPFIGGTRWIKFLKSRIGRSRGQDHGAATIRAGTASESK